MNPPLEKEIAWVKDQKSKGLFDYSLTDMVVDKFRSEHLPVVGNVVKVVVGALTFDAGVSICGATGGGCWVGAPMIIFGESNMVEGFSGLMKRYDGYGDVGFNPLRTGFNQLNPTWGNTAYSVLDLSTSVFALGAQVPLKMGASDGINSSISLFGATVPRFSNATIIPLTNVALPYGTTQATMLYGVGEKVVTTTNSLISAVEGKNK